MASDSKSKKDYEPVPDVEVGQATAGPSVNQEKAAESAKKQYPELNLDSDQARLMGTIDEAMKHAKLDLNLPKISQQELNTATENWGSQVKSFLYGLMQPTVTAIITLGAALYLEGQRRAQEAQEKGQQRIQDTEESFMNADWARYAVVLFPYVNATLIFCTTVRPIIGRCMTMFQPIFDAMQHAEASLQATVKKLGPFVDNTIDGIQKDFHTVMEPIKPALKQIESKAHLLEQVFENRGDKDEDFDIPDPSDIDRELDEAQGIVTDRIDEARNHLQVEKYIPKYLQSPRQFFWRIIFPLIVLGWIVQMAVAFETERLTHREVVTTVGTPDSRRVLFDVDLDTLLLDSSAAEPEAWLADIHEAGFRSPMQDGASSSSRDNGTQPTSTGYRNRAHDQYKHYSDLANNTLHSVRDNVTDMLHGYENDFGDQYSHYRGLAQSLVQDVIASYIIAVLQMLLLYIITSKAVQTWVVNQGMRQVQKGAERTLKEYGVSQALDEVLGQRLARVRVKILKLLRVYKKVQHTLEEAGAMTDFLPSGTAEQVAETLSGDAVKEAIAKSKKSGFFGRMFRKK